MPKMPPLTAYERHMSNWTKVKPGTGGSAENPCVWVLDEDKARERWADAYVVDGVVRWKSNDAVPPQDCLNDFAAVGCEFDMDASRYARKVDDDKFFAEYRAARARRTPEQRAEEMFEMRAAFGPGVTVVDCITGEKTRT